MFALISFTTSHSPVAENVVQEDSESPWHHEEARPEGHFERVRHVRSGPDCRVQGSLQHDRPEPRRVCRQGRPARHARFAG